MKVQRRKYRDVPFEMLNEENNQNFCYIHVRKRLSGFPLLLSWFLWGEIFRDEVLINFLILITPYHKNNSFDLFKVSETFDFLAVDQIPYLHSPLNPRSVWSRQGRRGLHLR